MTAPVESAGLDAAAFAALMAPLAPFERQPRLAVAVSGGADSMALALLARDWATTLGGTLTALTVDHGLRPASGAEAAQVAAWLHARGIAHRILRWEERPAAGSVQAAARAARYRMLEGWCRDNAVLHLLVAHNREDQAETLLLRLARGSGLDGLAGMAPVAERAHCRLLRPLLPVPRARLEATLRAAGQGWINDPSNLDPAYVRVRLRQGRSLLEDAGLGVERLAATAARLARARAALEAGVATVLARAVLVHPAGFVQLDPAVLKAAPEELGLRALAAVLAMAGGGQYPPRLDRLERLYRRLPEGLGGGRTLAGCRLLPRRGRLLVCREPAAMASPVPAPPGAEIYWDGRFCLYLPKTAPEGLRLGGLGATRLGAAAGKFPAAVQAGLPALSDDRSVAVVPALGYVRGGGDAGWLAALRLALRPSRPLSSAGFTVV